MKKLAKKLEFHPHSRCYNLSECIDQVKNGLNNVFIHVTADLGLNIAFQLIYFSLYFM